MGGGIGVPDWGIGQDADSIPDAAGFTPSRPLMVECQPEAGEGERVGNPDLVPCRLDRGEETWIIRGRFLFS